MRLFGTDGVRGKAGDFLDSFLAMRLAMAAGIYFKEYHGCEYENSGDSQNSYENSSILNAEIYDNHANLNVENAENAVNSNAKNYAKHDNLANSSTTNALNADKYEISSKTQSNNVNLSKTQNNCKNSGTLNAKNCEIYENSMNLNAVNLNNAKPENSVNLSTKNTDNYEISSKATNCEIYENAENSTNSSTTNALNADKYELSSKAQKGGINSSHKSTLNTKIHANTANSANLNSANHDNSANLSDTNSANHEIIANLNTKNPANPSNPEIHANSTNLNSTTPDNIATPHKKSPSKAQIYAHADRTGNILVGKDTRRSGYMIENAIVSGLTAIGYNVIQVGPMPTPAIAFLTEDMRCDAGIMISASHNAYFDNGIKFFDAHGNKLDEDAEAKIEQIYADDRLIQSAKAQDFKIGQSKRIDDVIGRYIVSIKNSFPKHLTLKPLRVVLDTANGASYKVAPTIFKELGAEVIVLNDEPNGLNINENCGALHPANLAAEVKRLRADVGFALDGDADRLVVVDERGEIAHGDSLIGVLAVFLKEQGKLNSAVVATIMSNGALKDFLNAHKIDLQSCQVGDKFVLEKLKAVGGNFGGEQSGHLVFTDYAKTGDGLIAALQFSALMLTKNQKASKILSEIKPYPQVLENIKVAQKKDLSRLKGLKELESALKKDKIRSLFRYSGTENVLRLLLEGEDAKVLDAKMKEVVKFFKGALDG